MNTLPRIWTAQEVAEYLKVSKEAVIKEFESGRLRGFLVGGEWRCTDDDLRNYVGKGVELSPVREVPSEVGKGSFVPISPFEYRWPKKKSVPEKAGEFYDEAYETTRYIGTGGRSLVFTVGFANRKIGGQLRRRVTVWLDKRRPLVEFAGGHDYDTSGILASVIKLPNNKQLRPTEPIPPEYGGFKTASYESVVRVAGASRNLAIVVHKSDLELMVRHAIIRARWKHYI
ncbi:MAG: helix-turn-helix domain-containing protein [Chloroflexota bacterium]